MVHCRILGLCNTTVFNVAPFKHLVCALRIIRQKHRTRRSFASDGLDQDAYCLQCRKEGGPSRTPRPIYSPTPSHVLIW